MRDNGEYTTPQLRTYADQIRADLTESIDEFIDLGAGECRVSLSLARTESRSFVPGYAGGGDITVRFHAQAENLLLIPDSLR